jgi:serine/threonine protein kinase
MDYKDFIKDYEVLKKLGQGANGQAFLVENKEGVKYIVKKSIKYKDEKFIHESNILKKIKKECNPYLVCIHDSGPGYIVLDYIPNSVELYEYLKENKERGNFMILKNLLQDLFVLHTLGIVHRDIKPENILINPNTYDTRYIDYDTSCEEGHISCMLNRAGTPDYISPEQWKGVIEKLDEKEKFEMLKKSDVFSLGVVFLDVCYDTLNKWSYWGIDDISKKTTKDKVISQMKANKVDISNKFFPMILLMLNPDWKDRPSVADLLEIIDKVNEM